MIQYINDNIAMILISAVIFVLMAWVIIFKIRQRSNGDSSCGCGCSGCPKPANVLNSLPYS
ncbi:FeoB-associated Cys-rich membrane protein [Ruminiclostridium cellulolyticum]|uniref:FeoB-associated Cys-rich membrane protein n=1 Tax=Ruminiclostridium cellulolyticum TaxID=1521 RepID=UPI00059F0DD3